MNKRKHLYSFDVLDINGKKRTFGLLKPNRKEKESGDLYYASKLSELISAGVLPKILWDKLFKNNGGTTSEKDRDEYTSLWAEFIELNSKSSSFESTGSENKSEELLGLQQRLAEIKSSIQELEISQVNAFENTAEAKARNKSIAWWTTAISAEKNDSDEWELIFKQASIEDKLDAYEEISENDKFLYSCLSRLNYLVTVWYLGGANSQEEFEKLDKDYFGVPLEEKETPLPEQTAKEIETIPQNELNVAENANLV